MKTRFLAVIAGLIFLTACEQSIIDETPDPFFSQWMSFLSDEAAIRNIVIPGSHDAGSVTMPSAAETQNSYIRTQLLYGVRYFDIRVQKKSARVGDFSRTGFRAAVCGCVGLRENFS